MIRIQRASLVGLLTLVVASTAYSVAAASGPGGGTRFGVRSLPAADAVPTTTAAGPTGPAGPTTALPNLPTVPTVAAPPTAPPLTAPPATVPQPTTAATTIAPNRYRALADDTGMLTVEVPTSWTDYDLGPFVEDDGTVRPGMAASTDLEAFDDEWSAPGVVYSAFRFQPDANVLFARYDFSGTCTDGGIVAYTDDVFNGWVRTFTGCAAAQSTNYLIVANAPGNQVTIVLNVQVLTAADEADYQHILGTFNVDPNVSMPTETVPPATTTPLPSTPLPTAPLPTAPLPIAPLPTVPAPTVPVPAPPVLPTSPLLTTPVTTPVTVPVTAPPGTGVPAGYQVATDDTGRLSVQVPSTWIDIDGTPGFEGGMEVAAVSAAPNLTTFRETFDGPGLLIHETPFQVDPAAELARRGLAGTCTAGPVAPNPNPAFSGVYQSWLDCGGTTTDWHVLVANPADGRQTTVVMVVQTLTPADEEALKVAFSSYQLSTTV